jgi:hypothetical protein
MSGIELQALNEAIDGVASVPLRRLDGPSLRALVLALASAVTRLQAVAASAVEVFDGNAHWAADGAYNMANWLATQTGEARSSTGSKARLACNLGQMPLARQAMLDGALTESHVRILARGLGPRTRALFSEHEAALVASATSLSGDDFATVMDQWVDMADPDGAAPRAERPDELHINQTLDGRIEGRFSLTKELGLPILEAIKAKTNELFHRDKRLRDVDATDPLLDDSPATRRARALSELIEAGSCANPRQSRKPAFTLQLRKRTDPFGNEVAVCETNDGSVIPTDLAYLWACDSWVVRLAMNSDGVPLDLGRLVRTASDDQLRALVARDGGCAVYGCDRPVSWTDAHHVEWWVDGGRTDIGNLVLLCRHHHRRVHKGELVVRMVKGLPEVYTAEGRLLGTRLGPGSPRALGPGARKPAPVG